MAEPTRLRRFLVTTPFLDFLLRLYRERLTARGRYVLWVATALAFLGVDTGRSQVFLLFAIAAAAFLPALAYAVGPPPRARLECEMPTRAAARTPLAVAARVTSQSGRPLHDLRLLFPPPRRDARRIGMDPPEVFLEPENDGSASATVRFEALRRGRYVLRGPALRRTDPLRLVAGRAVTIPDETLLVYPRFFTMEEFTVPVGRRYQPGGIPLSSNLGESIEFVGTREYRAGDPVKNIHWRSWARRGEPVVREHQEEYFCRIAIILDTFVPARGGAAAERTFEAAVSVVASIADFFSRSEYIVDILAAGPDLYEVSSGRSLAYLENILDVLACLEPCPDPPFRTIGPALFDRLAQTTTVVAVLQDWDKDREAFLRNVHALGTAVRSVIVHEGETAEPWGSAEALGEVSRMTPMQVESAIHDGAPRFGRG